MASSWTATGGRCPRRTATPCLSKTSSLSQVSMRCVIGLLDTTAPTRSTSPLQLSRHSVERRPSCVALSPSCSATCTTSTPPHTPSISPPLARWTRPWRHRPWLHVCMPSTHTTTSTRAALWTVLWSRCGPPSCVDTSTEPNPLSTARRQMTNDGVVFRRRSTSWLDTPRCCCAPCSRLPRRRHGAVFPVLRARCCSKCATNTTSATRCASSSTITTMTVATMTNPWRHWPRRS
mmetsp:Transcript_7067/g.15684  ORF Transcript_7067/g.15684 Transcript_7067/m.15684 type:complete len:234 (+) Transcript_7067:283-984(+)